MTFQTAERSIDPAHLPADLERRFGGLSRLYGAEGALRIRNACVAVVGVGGVGSWAAEALARSGVCKLVLIDMDHIAESNINRQIHALHSTIGQAKVDAMRERIAQINPHCEVLCVDDFVTADNWPAVLPTSVDAVIDACDDAKAKLVMAAWSIKEKRCLITVGAAGGKKMADGVAIDDLSQVSHDPLLARMRYSLRKFYGAPRDGKKIGVPCVFSREAVRQPSNTSCDAHSADGSLNCQGYGSLVSVTATFGQCAAGWVMNKLSVLS